MIGPYPTGKPPHTYPRQMPEPEELLPGLRGTPPPQGFAELFKSCVHAAAVPRPSAEGLLGWLNTPQA
jgi:hypothetical protein